MARRRATRAFAHRSGLPLASARPGGTRAAPCAYRGRTASNHTLDGGQRGVNTTLGVLDRFGVRHAGSYRTRAAARRPTVLEAKGVKVAFLSYTALTNGQPIPHPWTLNLARARRIVRDARRARRAGADAVIVNLHWGAEYRRAPPARSNRWPPLSPARGLSRRWSASTSTLSSQSAGFTASRWSSARQSAFQSDCGVLPGRLPRRAHSPARPPRRRVRRPGPTRALPAHLRAPP